MSSSVSHFIKRTPLEKNESYSKLYCANIFFKREDLQTTRSFKIRGATHKILSSTQPERNKGIVTCSAGNHAQGVAYVCKTLQIKCYIFVPLCTPQQKINRITEIGDAQLELKIIGNNFNDSLTHASQFCSSNGLVFVHPFDDADVIEGQSYIAGEIFDEIEPDYIIVPVGGGGLISGVLKEINKRNIMGNTKTRVIGIEPMGCRKMHASLTEKQIVTLSPYDTFVDGASVARPGVRTFEICHDHRVSLVLHGRHLRQFQYTSNK